MNHSSSLVPDNWYESFFTAPFNEFWAAIFSKSVAEQEVSFVERHLQLSARARVLDVPCGSGRHSLELARRDYSVTGIDISADAVTRAQDSVRSEDLRADFFRCDMQHFCTDTPFDGALCLGNSFGYFPHSGMQLFLQSLYGALKTGARLVVDTGTTAESILVALKTEAKYEMGGYMFEVENDYDIARSRLVTHTILRRESEEWRQSFSHGVYTCAELGRLFDAAGFDIVNRFADLDGSPYRLGQPRLLLIAERR